MIGTFVSMIREGHNPMCLTDEMLEVLPLKDKLLAGLRRLLFDDRTASAKRLKSPDVSVDALRARCHLVLAEGEEAVDILDQHDPCQIENYYSIEEWTESYFRCLIDMGSVDEVLFLIREYLKHVGPRRNIIWVVRIYKVFLQIGDNENAGFLRDLLLSYDEKLLPELDFASRRVESRDVEGWDEVGSCINTANSRIAVLLKDGNGGMVDDLVVLVRDRLAPLKPEHSDHFLSGLDDSLAISQRLAEKDEKAVEAERAYEILLSGRVDEAEIMFRSLSGAVGKNYHVLMGTLKILMIKGEDHGAIHNYAQKLMGTHSGDVEACLLGAEAFVVLAERKMRIGQRDGRVRFGRDVKGLCDAACRYLKMSKTEKGSALYERLKKMGYRVQNYAPTVTRTSRDRKALKVSTDDAWAELGRLLKDESYSAADALLRRVLLCSNNPADRLNARKCLFEVALILGDLTGARRLLRSISNSIPKDEASGYSAKLSSVIREGSTASSYGSRVWDRMGFIRPVDHLAGKVTGFKKRK